MRRDQWWRPRAVSKSRGSPKEQHKRQPEDDSKNEKHDKGAERKVSSSVVLASVADVGSHIGHPQ